MNAACRGGGAPTVSDGVPGYDPPSGPGYRTLRVGELVYVPTPRTAWVSAPSTSQPSVSTAPAAAIEGGLTQKGPSVPGWSWQVRRHKTPAERMVPQAVSPIPALLANSFASLAVSTEPVREQLGLAQSAYTAVRYSRDPCPIKLDGLRQDIKYAHKALDTAMDACNPFPSVDPPFQDYFVDPSEEKVMDPFEKEGSDSFEEEVMASDVAE